MFQKGLAPILIILLIAAALGGYFIYQKQRDATISIEKPFITTFNDCINSFGGNIIETYPRQCEDSEGKIFIEELKDPIDTSNWQKVDTKLGFIFRCPPKWQCSLSSDAKDYYAARAQINNYMRYSFGFLIIKAKDFQQSDYRHPNYKNGVEWLGDLLAKNPKAIEILPVAIRYQPNNDGRDYPAYYNFKLDQLQEIIVRSKKVLLVNGNGFMSLNNQDLLVVESEGLFDNSPLIKTVVMSVAIK